MAFGATTASFLARKNLTKNFSHFIAAVSVLSTLLMFAIGTIGCVFCVYYFQEK